MAHIVLISQQKHKNSGDTLLGETLVYVIGERGLIKKGISPYTECCSLNSLYLTRPIELHCILTLCHILFLAEGFGNYMHPLFQAYTHTHTFVFFSFFKSRL